MEKRNFVSIGKQKHRTSVISASDLPFLTYSASSNRGQQLR